MAVSFGQTKPKKVPRFRPKQRVQETETEVYKAAISDGGKSILESLWDGSEFALDNSFEALGAAYIGQELAKRYSENKDEYVSVEEAKEKWQLELDEPLPLPQVLYLHEVQQTSLKHFNTSLQDLSLKHGPANFVASLVGIFGTAAALPTNWLGLGAYKAVKSVPRYLKLNAAAKALTAARGTENAQKVKQAREAWKKLKIAVNQTPVGIVEAAGVVGAENVLFEHLREEQGVTGNKWAAFGIGAGAGLFLGAAGRAMTTSARSVAQIPPMKHEGLVKPDVADAAVAPKAEPMADVKAGEKITAPEEPKTAGPQQKEKSKPGPVLAKEVTAEVELTPEQRAVEEFTQKVDEDAAQHIRSEDQPVNPKLHATSIEEFDEVLENIHQQLARADRETAPRSELAEQSEWQKIFDDNDNLEDTVVIPEGEVIARQREAEEIAAAQRAERAERDKLFTEQQAKESSDPRDKQAVAKAEIAEEITSGDLDTTKIKEAQTADKSVEELVNEMKQVDISQVPAHIAWGRVLFGKSWEDDLVKATATLRQMGVMTPVTDIYPWMKHRKAFFGRYYQGHNWLKKRHGVYSSNMLKDEMLHLDQRLIDYHLGKSQATTKGMGANPAKDGKQAKPPTKEAAAKTNLAGINAIETTMPKVEVTKNTNAKPPKVGEEKVVKVKGKETKIVDANAVRPTVDNAENAKLALKQRYPDIEFEASKSASVAGADGKATPTIGKDDIFNLTYKKPATEEATPGTIAEVLLMKVPIQKGAADYKGEFVVDVLRNDVNQLTGKPSLIPDEPKTYKTLRGALNAFNRTVSNKVKVPTLDEIKMGPKRGAEKIQELTEELVTTMKQLGDCNGGKSMQSEVSGPNAPNTGGVGKGTSGTS